MRSIHLPGTSTSTSALGFGCAGLTSLNDRRRALELLHAAFDAGITHYDVARLYGFGHAEGIVGEFIKGRRDRVTVTTKFGLEPPTGMLSGNAGVVSLARTIVRRLPAVAGLIRRRARQMVAEGSFSPVAAARSLERSLTQLRTDYVDFLLLHEGTLADARSDALREFLSAQMARGTVRNIGVASGSDTLGNDLAVFPPEYVLFQFEDNVFDRRMSSTRGTDGVAVITHSVLRPLVELSALAADRDTITMAWSERVGADLSQSRVLAQMLLAWALARNTRGPVLFSTTRPEHLRDNTRVADDARANGRAEQFGLFVDLLLGRGTPPTDTTRPETPSPRD